MASNMTLYSYWRSSCSWRVRWALEVKGISYDLKTINLLKNEQKEASFRKINPFAHVPVLEINGQYLSESLAILEFIEELYPKPALLPRDPFARAKTRELCLIIAAGTQPLQNLEVQKFHSADERQRKDFATHWIARGLGVYEAVLATTAGTYSVGGELSLADLCLIPQCYNALRFNVDLARFPTIKRIYDFCLTLETCRRAAPERQPDAVKA